jgi:uncharacterized caspase-like protein
LVSSEVVKRETEQKRVLALAQSGEPEQTGASAASATPTSDAQQAAVPVESGRRVALVIGNAAYPDAGLPLVQPVNNARALANVLKEKGFDVELGVNLTKQAMERSIETFKSKIRPSSVALIFFSGFGIQAARQSYMIPVNAQIWNEADVRRFGVSLEPLLAEIEAEGVSAKVVVVDASRRNPFERRFRSLSTGLAAIHAPDATLMIYAAAPGKVVNDGEGELSPLIDQLIEQMRAPGQAAEDIFNRTRMAVSRATDREQVPWVSSSLVENFVFGPVEPAQTQQSAP